MHFPLSYSREYFSGLTSEEKVVTWKSGTPRVEWKKRKGIDKARNEPLDCRVYALAALRSLPMASRKLRSGRTYELKRPETNRSETSRKPKETNDSLGNETETKQPAPPKPPPRKSQQFRRPARRGGWSI
jgi:phage terminase large subunit GpA-like protein